MNRFQKLSITLALISMFAASLNGLALAHDGKDRGKGREGGREHAYEQKMKKDEQRDIKDEKRDSKDEKRDSKDAKKSPEKGKVDLISVMNTYAPEMTADWTALKTKHEEIEEQIERLEKSLRGSKKSKPAQDEVNKKLEKAKHELAEKEEEVAKAALKTAVLANDAAAIKAALTTLFNLKKAELADQLAKLEELKKAVTATPVPTVAPSVTPAPTSVVSATPSSSPTPSASPSISSVPSATPAPTAAAQVSVASSKLATAKSSLSLIQRIKQFLSRK